MSTGADCRFWELEPGRWYYSLQEYPYGATEEYAHHGPFATEEAAERHLHRHYANPGGSLVIRHAEIAKSPWAARYRARAEIATL